MEEKLSYLEERLEQRAASELNGLINSIFPNSYNRTFDLVNTYIDKKEIESVKRINVSLNNYFLPVSDLLDLIKNAIYEKYIDSYSKKEIDLFLSKTDNLQAQIDQLKNISNIFWLFKKYFVYL